MATSEPKTTRSPRPENVHEGLHEHLEEHRLRFRVDLIGDREQVAEVSPIVIDRHLVRHLLLDG